MSPAISCARPPNISATPNTIGVAVTATASALIMLSMNVVTAKARSASGAELPQSSVDPRVGAGSAMNSARAQS
jgi:hypothetical protein